MGYELIPIKVEKYIMTAKEVAKFLKRGNSWYSYAERVPKAGEMIHKNNGETQVITSGDEHYIQEYYSKYEKGYWKYTVLTKRNDYHIIWKLIYVNF